VKAQKLRTLRRKGGETVSVDEIRSSLLNIRSISKAAYKEEKFPKPRNIIGMGKRTCRCRQMEKLMLTNIVVKDDDLRQPCISTGACL